MTLLIFIVEALVYFSILFGLTLWCGRLKGAAEGAMLITLSFLWVGGLIWGAANLFLIHEQMKGNG